MDGDRSGIGIKAVTYERVLISRDIFQHFPVMPGVLIIEGMAQTAGALCMNSVERRFQAGSGILSWRSTGRGFRRPVRPGDTVYYHMKKIRSRGRGLALSREKPRSTASWRPRLN